MKYPKINTIWKRDEKTHKIIEDDFSKEEFKNIKNWYITEKIDGTNIRIILKNSGDANLSPSGVYVEFQGRTDKATIPQKLLDYLHKTFTFDAIQKVFSENDEVILYGEGYGGYIQNVGKKYKEDVSFILFDVFVDNKWWLKREDVDNIAKELGIKSVPSLGIMNIETAINLIKEGGGQSLIAKEALVTEGIVARSHPLMLFRDGKPIMWKLKVSDYG